MMLLKKTEVGLDVGPPTLPNSQYGTHADMPVMGLDRMFISTMPAHLHTQ